MRGGDPAGDPRLAPLTASLRLRLGPLCQEWDRAEFAVLVERIALRQLRWADAGSGG